MNKNGMRDTDLQYLHVIYEELDGPYGIQRDMSLHCRFIHIEYI